MLTKTAELIGAAVAGLGGLYFYKRSKGSPAPAVAPVLPKMPPSPPANTGMPSAALAAVTGGNPFAMGVGTAQSAIDAANAAGAYASSDLGQAAGGGQVYSPASNAGLTADDSALDGVL